MEERIKEENVEKDRMMRDSLERDRAHRNELKEKDEIFCSQLKEERNKIAEIQNELDDVKKTRDELFEQKFDVGTIVDEKDAEIMALNNDKQKLVDEIASRKVMIEQMSANLMFHEKESADLAKKLSIMKQQILDNDSGYGLSKKFGCVRIGRIKDTVCTVSYSLSHQC